MRSDERRDLLEPLSSEGPSPSSETATLRVRESEPLSSELLPESSVLGLQILDDLLLLAANPIRSE